MQPPKLKAVEGGGCPGGIGGDQRQRCVAASLSMLIAATLAFLAYVPFFPDDGAGGVYRWWSCQDCAGALGEFPAVETAAADGPTAGGSGGHAPTSLSHIVFGIGASARTWDQRRWYVELWWRPEAMRGHVWLDEQPVGAWPAATCPPYRVSADASRFGERASASQMARIVADSFLAISAGAGQDEVRWFVMGDDDTVFFPDNLVAVLRKYDHEEMYYVGAPSESVEQNVMHSYGMAFGSGGFAVSYPAAAELAKAIDGCLDRYSRFYGSDQRVQACLSELGIPLTREPGFHQVDIRGDAYGMLAAHPVAPLVSLHHLDHIEPISPVGHTPLAAVRPLVRAARFDSARLLQQAFGYQQGPGYTWSVSIAWGYTVQLYPWAVAPHELEVPLQTFKTWRSRANGPFVFNTRPLMSPDSPCYRPAMFFLSRVRNETSGTVSEYSRHAVKSDKECEQASFRAASTFHTVKVLAPKMSHNEWKLAPRRHCCKTKRTTSGTVLEVNLWFSRNNQLLQRITMPHNMKKVMKKIDKIKEEGRMELNLVHQESRGQGSRNNELLQLTRMVMVSNLEWWGGRGIEKEKIISLLLTSQANRDISIIPVVGLGGIGKTTLAESVLADKRVSVFDVSVWEEDGNNFERLKEMLQHGHKGSRIIVTTRNLHVMQQLRTGFLANERKICPVPAFDIINLSVLEPGDYWELMKQRAFGSDDDHSGLEEIGKQIAGKCGGLPLVANALGQVMSELRTVGAWEDIRDTKVDLGLREVHQKETLERLMLSYYYMKLEFKMCFTYLATFPKGFVMDSNHLI